MSYIPVLAILNFQQPLLQCSVSHDHSEIILICGFSAQETFIIIRICLMNRNFKRTEILWFFLNRQTNRTKNKKLLLLFIIYYIII